MTLRWLIFLFAGIVAYPCYVEMSPSPKSRLISVWKLIQDLDNDTRTYIVAKLKLGVTPIRESIVGNALWLHTQVGFQIVTSYVPQKNSTSEWKDISTLRLEKIGNDKPTQVYAVPNAVKKSILALEEGQVHEGVNIAVNDHHLTLTKNQEVTSGELGRITGWSFWRFSIIFYTARNQALTKYILKGSPFFRFRDAQTSYCSLRNGGFVCLIVTKSDWSRICHFKWESLSQKKTAKSKKAIRIQMNTFICGDARKTYLTRLLEMFSTNDVHLSEHKYRTQKKMQAGYSNRGESTRHEGLSKASLAYILNHGDHDTTRANVGPCEALTWMHGHACHGNKESVMPSESNIEFSHLSNEGKGHA